MFLEVGGPEKILSEYMTQNHSYLFEVITITLLFPQYLSNMGDVEKIVNLVGLRTDQEEEELNKKEERGKGEEGNTNQHTTDHVLSPVVCLPGFLQKYENDNKKKLCP